MGAFWFYLRSADIGACDASANQWFAVSVSASLSPTEYFAACLTVPITFFDGFSLVVKLFAAGNR